MNPYRSSRLTLSEGPPVPSLLSDWGIIGPAIAARIVGGDAAYLAFALLVIHAGRGYQQAIQAIFLSWLFASLNPAISTSSSDVELIRVMIILVAFVRCVFGSFSRSNAQGLRTLWRPILGFLGLCVVNSIFVSSLTTISLLKTVLFGLTVSALIVAWTNLGLRQIRMQAWFLNALFVVAMLSGGFWLIGGGYEKNGTGFQGILDQPQGFGIVMAILASWHICKMFGESQFTGWLFFIAAYVVACLVLSASRTGLVAALAGCSFAVILSLFSRREELRHVVRRMSPLVRAGIACAGIAAVLLFSGQAVKGAMNLALKGDFDSSFSENFAGSRGDLIETSLYNFSERPIFGTGFATPSHFDDYDIRYDPVFGLPISAPVEKGVLPVAVLEELGLTGALLLIWMVWAIVQHTLKFGEFHAIAVGVTALSVNIGEAVLFSPSGYGLLVWLAISMSIGSSSERTIGAKGVVYS